MCLTETYSRVRVGKNLSEMFPIRNGKKLERLIKMCLNETYSRVLVGKHLSDMFCINNGLKQGDALSIAIAFQLCFRVCH